MKRDRRNGAGVSLKCQQLSAVGKFPELDLAVPPASGHPPAVPPEGETHDLPIVRPKFPSLSAGRNVPESKHSVFATGSQRLEIRAEADCPDAIRLRLQRERLAAGAEIPQDDFPL